MASVRRLTAILAADVAGYSRLMGADEEGTHERLQAHLRELVNPKVEEYRGRIVKNTGDGFLAEFPSVVDAVRCGVEVQRGMADGNEETPPRKRIEFRIGINLGDVIAEEHDIFGDGVNVAARLEGLAEPPARAPRLSIVYLDAEIAHRAFQLRVPEKQLYCTRWRAAGRKIRFAKLSRERRTIRLIVSGELSPGSFGGRLTSRSSS
jgi:hypothetical protein